MSGVPTYFQDLGSDCVDVAMFDEIDELTAIFICTNTPPVNGTFIDYEGMPEDHYMKLTGLAGKILKKLKMDLLQLHKPICIPLSFVVQPEYVHPCLQS